MQRKTLSKNLPGSNYAPAKRVDSGDGFFFSLVIAIGIWITGALFQLIYSSGQTSNFEPIASVGGALWATGNMCVPIIMKTIGLSMGLLMWGSVALLGGWARFCF